MTAVRKKIDSRVKTLLENGVKVRKTAWRVFAGFTSHVERGGVRQSLHAVATIYPGEHSVSLELSHETSRSILCVCEC